MDYKQIKAIEKANKERIKKVCPNVTEESGIYILTRFENNFKYCYVGQAKRILTRLAQHLSGYQHIDLSLKKHGLYSQENKTGWEVDFVECSILKLDRLEQKLIEAYANSGYQMRNKTSGGQGQGKEQIADFKEPKGYRDGLKQGYLNAQRDIAKWCKWFDIKYDANKVNACKAYAKFKEFIEC